MKTVGFFCYVGFLALLSPFACFAQSPASPPTPRNDYVISVQELAMPHKAASTFEKGTHLLLKGDFEASVPFFRDVIKQAPYSYRAYHNLALALSRLGQLDAAAQEFQKSIDLSNGGFAPSLFGFAMILYQRAEYQEAENLIRRGLLDAPGSGVGNYCLGLVQFSLGRISDAERSALEALKLNPGNADPHLLLARIHERQHNPSAVLTDVQSYLKLEPKGTLHAEALDLLHGAQQDRASRVTSLN